MTSSALSLSTSCLLDLVGIRKRLLDVFDPPLLEESDDARAARGKNVLDVFLDLLLLVVVDDRAGAGADPGAHGGRREECRREDEADDRAADRADRGSLAHVVGVVLDLDLPVSVAADEDEAVHRDHVVAGELLDVVPILLGSARIGVRRDVQVYGCVTHDFSFRRSWLTRTLAADAQPFLIRIV